MKEIIFSKPNIKIKNTLQLIKKSLIKNYPNEGSLTNIFENRVKNILKIKYAVATTNGTSALCLALKANNIGHGDEVIIPNITFLATANAVHMAGAKVILADVLKKNLLIDPSSLIKRISKKTKAIIPVHISGRGENIREIVRIANKYKIKVIEDAAEAFGSKFKNKSLGSFGICGCFSFAPNKIITTGQGGLIVTNDKKIFMKIKHLKDQGRVKSLKKENFYNYRGFNFKFTDLQASLGISQLTDFSKRKRKLINIYKFYKKKINENDEFKIIGFNIKNGELPLWTDIYCKNSKEFFNFLKKKKILCRFFWNPINSIPPYKRSFKNLEQSKKLKNKLLWLPSSLDLSKKELNYICLNINNYLNKKLNLKKNKSRL